MEWTSRRAPRTNSTPMLGRPRRFVSFTAVIVCALGPVATRPPAKFQDDAPVSGLTIDATIRAYLDAAPVPGVAVAVTHGDRVLVAQGYGHTPGGDPIGQHTPMAVASVSKSFTALAVMQLVEAGRVDLDRPVRVYLPEFTGRLACRPGDRSTVIESNVRHVGSFVSRFQPPATALAARAVAGLRTAPLAAMPGSRWDSTIPTTRLPRAWSKW